MNPLLLRYLPQIGVLVAAALFGFWLTHLYLDHRDLRAWQDSILSELTAQTVSPDSKGALSPVQPADAIARIRLIAQNARTFEDGLVRCNQAAILYAESRDKALARAAEALERARQAEEAARTLRSRLLKERFAGAGCLPSDAARVAWQRLSK